MDHTTQASEEPNTARGCRAQTRRRLAGTRTRASERGSIAVVRRAIQQRKHRKPTIMTILRIDNRFWMRDPALPREVQDSRISIVAQARTATRAECAMPTERYRHQVVAADEPTPAARRPRDVRPIHDLVPSSSSCLRQPATHELYHRQAAIRSAISDYSRQQEAAQAIQPRGFLSPNE